MMKLLIEKALSERQRVSFRTWVRLVITSFAVLGYSPSSQAHMPSVAFFYGKPMPVASLAHFDWVVVEAGNLDDIAPLQSAGADVFAYVSVGEVEAWRNVPGVIQSKWLLGDNRAWKTKVVDLTHEGWKQYLLETRMAPLWAKGYRGFFLDTLDSYQLAVTDAAGKAKQRRALVEIVKSVADRFPGAKLLVNRGFEILPDVANLLLGVVAESLFRGWDPNTRQYRRVAESDRAWLLQQLNEAKDRYRLPVTVVDYVAPGNRELARQTARRIAALGFIPWISTPAMDVLGVGLIENVQRMLPHDSLVGRYADLPTWCPCHG